MAKPNPPPIERSPKTGEIFLRLRKHPNVVLTPPRVTDAARIAECLQDPRIYSCLVSPPVPYHLEHAEGWLSQIIPERHTILEELRPEDDQNGVQTLSGCPFQFIRELQDDGTDFLIGSIDLVRYPKPTPNETVNLLHAHEPSKNKEDESVWTIGDWLAPSHHRQGIMSDAVDTLLHDWGVPRMKVRKVVVSAFTENMASVKVFEKNGFKSVGIAENAVQARGKLWGLHTLEWSWHQEDEKVL